MARKYYVSEKLRGVPRQVIQALRTQRKSRGTLTDLEAMKLADYYGLHLPSLYGGDLLENRVRYEDLKPSEKSRTRRIASLKFWSGVHSGMPGDFSSPFSYPRGRFILEHGSEKMSPKKRKMLADYREAIAAAELSGRPLFYTRTRRTR